MKTLFSILRYQLSDALRSRSMLFHGLLYLLVAEGLLLTAGYTDKALASLINVVLLLVPLISLVFGTVHTYNAREFVVLLLTQPVRRRDLFAGMYLGLALPLAATFAVGTALPFMWHGAATTDNLVRLMTLIGIGSVLTVIFVALAFLISIRYTDRIKGIGIALLTWMLLAIVFDGAVLLATHALSAYPLEQPILGAMMLNPIDLGRVILLMVFDASALMGYTGAVFVRFFGSPMGILAAAAALSLWIVGPLVVGLRSFGARDF